MNHQQEKQMHLLLDKIEEDVEYQEEFSEEEYAILEAYAKEEEETIRARVARILVNFTKPKEEAVLVKLTEDPDDLVRVEACDSLSGSHSLLTQKFLKEIAQKDSSVMVRGYAISSIGAITLEIGNISEIVHYLKDYLEREKEVFVKINLDTALYLLGEKQYLEDLIGLLNTPLYQNRCAVTNCLEEILRKENKEKIKRALLEQKKKEKTYAVSSTIDRVLKEIEEKEKKEWACN